LICFFVYVCRSAPAATNLPQKKVPAGCTSATTQSHSVPCDENSLPSVDDQCALTVGDGTSNAGLPQADGVFYVADPYIASVIGIIANKTQKVVVIAEGTPAAAAAAAAAATSSGARSTHWQFLRQHLTKATELSDMGDQPSPPPLPVLAPTPNPHWRHLRDNLMANLVSNFWSAQVSDMGEQSSPPPPPALGWRTLSAPGGPRKLMQISQRVRHRQVLRPWRYNHQCHQPYAGHERSPQTCQYHHLTALLSCRRPRPRTGVPGHERSP
jgi:hypothetical protein